MRVLSQVSNCLLKLANQPITADLNVLPLGSYDILKGMDSLEKKGPSSTVKPKLLVTGMRKGRDMKFKVFKNLCN